MIFIINSDIEYNTESCILRHLPTNESISLSISSGRLFEMLLHSGGEILPREKLLSEVWDKYGLTGSNSNLNQYLSLLRRTLSGFDCSNFIITVPKEGIKINTDVTIEVRYSEESEIAEEPAAYDPELNSENTKRVKKSLTSRLIFSLISLLVFLLLLFGFHFFKDLNRNKEIDVTVMQLDSGCKLYSLQDLSKKDEVKLLVIINKFLLQNDLRCGSGRRVYFDHYTSYSIKDYGRTLISYCYEGKNKEVVNCANFYYLDGGLK